MKSLNRMIPVLGLALLSLAAAPVVRANEGEAKPAQSEVKAEKKAKKAKKTKAKKEEKKQEGASAEQPKAEAAPVDKK